MEIKKAITPETKAIVPVHLYGHPCDMDPIMEVAEKYDLRVVEDAAEAHGAEYKGKKVGSFGDISCFSFYGNKIITTGEGGMCLTNDKGLVEKMRILRDHGMNPGKRYWHDIVGFNYKMTNMQAAIGVAQLEKIDQLVEKKRKNAYFYNSLLNDAVGITLPPEKEWAKNVYWMYSILFNDNFGTTRDEFIKKLEEKGIETRPLFYPIHTMPHYKTNKVFPVAEELSRRGISLPSGVALTKKEISKVASFISTSK